jgi:hypothetical protein
MAKVLDQNTTSVGLKRLGRDATTTADELGPLASLVGTWMGSNGWELMVVPDGPKSRRVIIRPYIEVITFSALGAPVPDRGGPVPDLCITGLMYSTRITDAETNEPLHLETGMWFYLGETQPQPVARSASIPHGDSLLALGTHETIAGPPPITSHTAVPNAGPATPPGYNDPELIPVSFGGVEFSAADPQKVLTDVLSTQDVVETITLSLSTTDTGGILNIPFVDKNANASAFDCVFWIETIKDPKTGDETMQLQYSQITSIEFLPQFGNPSELITWPHVNVATLQKQ